MPRSNRRAIQSTVTRQALYETAIKLFREQGYYNTTVEDIAHGVGTSVGAFYYHFKCKEDVLFMLVNDLDRSYEEFYQLQLSMPNLTAVDMLRSMLLFLMKRYCQTGREFVTVCYGYMLREPELTVRMIDEKRADRRILRELIVRGQHEGCIRSELDPHRTANDLVKVIRGGILDWCLCGGDSSVEDFSASYVDLFIVGLSNSKLQK